MTRTWVAIALGFVAGVALTKIAHHFEAPKVVEVGIPEWEIPISSPRVREVHRRPEIYGRRKIF